MSDKEFERGSILPRQFYRRDTVTVAKELLGKYLIRRVGDIEMVGRIVEAEAYLGVSDPACHASSGFTPRTRLFFEKPGVAYVFVIYGIYHCLNAITQPKGEVGCVLIRALEPISGIKFMKKNRPVERLGNLSNGPGKLTQALDITLEQNGLDLTDPTSPLTIVGGKERDFEIIATARVGITKAAELPLRFYIGDNPFVSPYKK